MRYIQLGPGRRQPSMCEMMQAASPPTASSSVALFRICGGGGQVDDALADLQGALRLREAAVAAATDAPDAGGGGGGDVRRLVEARHRLALFHQSHPFRWTSLILSLSRSLTFFPIFSLSLNTHTYI